MNRRDPRRQAEGAHRVQAVLRELERQLPNAERVTATLEELARLLREQPDTLPAASSDLCLRALLQAQRAVNAAQAICACR